MEDKKEKISNEELTSIKEMTAALEKHKMQHKILELEYKLAISNIYVKYGLHSDDTIDTSGEIKRKVENIKEQSPSEDEFPAY